MPRGRPGLTIADIIQVVDQFLCFCCCCPKLSQAAMFFFSFFSCDDVDREKEGRRFESCYNEGDVDG